MGPQPPQPGPVPTALPPRIFVHAFSLAGISPCSATPWQSPAEVTKRCRLQKSHSPPESHPVSPNSPKSHPRRACGPVQVTEGRAGRGVAKDGQEPASQRSAPRGKNGHGPQGSKRSLALSLSPLLLLRLLKTQHLPENQF